MLHFGILGLDAAASRDDDDVNALSELVRIKSVYLSEPAADAVAHDGLAQLSGHGVSHAAGTPLRFQSIHDHIGRNGCFSFVIKPLELIILFQS